MSWNELNIDKKDVDKVAQKNKEHAIKLAKNYAVCFSTEDGKAVLQDMVDSFVMNNDTSFHSSNVNYEAAYHNGEAGIVKYIISQIKKAQTL